MSITDLLIYLLIAALVGLIAERLVGTGLYGLIGNVLVGLAGIWVMLNLFLWSFPGDLVVGRVPVITAILGAILVEVVLSLLLRSVRGRRTWRRL
jgi:uncharacterized membrane protein YeaQ/YmgE (transglycosylase-associated protein family)